MRRLAVVAAIVTLLGACGWMQPGYDAGKSNANQWENHVTLANVASLEDRVVPAPDPTRAIQEFITVNGHLIVADGANVYAYDTATCPTVDGSPCSSRWKVSGGPAIASDGGRLFIGNQPGFPGSVAQGVLVLALDGTVLGTIPHGGAQFTVDHGTVLTTDTTYSIISTGLGHTTYAINHELWRFASDCDPTACSETSLGMWDSHRIQGLNDISRGPTFSVENGHPHTLPLRDGVAVGTGARYDLTDPACQAPTPTCAPDAAYPGLTYAAAISPDHVMGIRYTLDGYGALAGKSLAWYPGPHAACAGSPASCAPTAVVDLGLTDSAAVAVGGDAVYVGRATGLDVYAEDGTTGCSTSSPRICTPIAHFATGTTGTIQVVDRRVYAGGAGGIHVLTIPGDIR